MRKLIIIALMVAGFATASLAAMGWFQDYIIVAGAQNSGYYWIGQDPGWATKFDGANLGNVPTGGFLIGADMRYWSDTQDRDGGAFYWRVDGGSITEIIWTQTYLGGNDYQGTYPTTVSVGSGLSLGQHTLEVWAKSWGTGQGDSWLSNDGLNYKATFTTVPEPTTLVLIGAGIAGLLVYRRRR